MRVKLYMIMFLAACLVILTLHACDNQTQGYNQNERAERHELACVLGDDDVWRIVDARDMRSTQIEVARGDTVVWYAPEDRDIYFQFMTEDLTGVYTEEVRQGESLTLLIGGDAQSGENRYAVFVYDAREYAQGESPPRMIVR
jgi:hypothetical protein